MSATVQDVRNVDFANELCAVSDAKIECVLKDEVPCYVNPSQFCNCADLAEALVAAHIITIGLRGTTSPMGPVTAESAGGLSRSYGSAAVSGSAGFWQSTNFGQRFWAIAQTRITTPVVACNPAIPPSYSINAYPGYH